MSPYNSASLIFEDCEEVATQIAKNWGPRQPHSHLMPRQEEPPRISPIHLIFPETRIIGLHFCRWWYGSIFIQICAVCSKRRIFSVTECILAVRGHSRSSKVNDWLKIAYFSHASLIRRPRSLPMFPFQSVLNAAARLVVKKRKCDSISHGHTNSTWWSPLVARASTNWL